MAEIKNIAAYRFVGIEDPDGLSSRLRAAAGERNLRGTVLVAPEGINLFLAGSAGDIDAFLLTLGREPGLADLETKVSWSDRQPFQRLKVKRKREIITFRDPGLDPAAGRAPSVAPATLRRWLRAGRDDEGREIRLLDTRNAQEAAYGSFAGALVLPIDKFTELPEALAEHRATLAGKTVVSFCTGGIRCEKAALWMRQSGIENVLQLEGGILGYFEQVGGEGYEGACFVFDERVALDPTLRPVST